MKRHTACGLPVVDESPEILIDIIDLRRND
jgi:hypothetical protein